MTYPKHAVACTYAREMHEQKLRCAQIYDNSTSWAEFKLKAAAEGIKSKKILFMFWLHYFFHNNPNGEIGDRVQYTAFFISLSICLTEAIIVIVLYKFAVIGILLAMCIWASIIMASICIYTIIVQIFEYYLKTAINALSRYARELE